jgi:hypothetical protein
VGDFLYITTDPLVIMEANAAMKDMGFVTMISALLLDGPRALEKVTLASICNFC